MQKNFFTLFKKAEFELDYDQRTQISDKAKMSSESDPGFQFVVKDVQYKKYKKLSYR